MLTNGYGLNMVRPTLIKEQGYGFAAVSYKGTEKQCLKSNCYFFSVYALPYPYFINDTACVLGGVIPSGFLCSRVAKPNIHAVSVFIARNRGGFLIFFIQRRFAMSNTATSTPTVSNHISSIPNETYYTVSLGKQAGQMSIIIKYHVDNQQWRFVDISAGITFLINPDTNLISFTQEQHDTAIQTFSQELRKFVSQQIPYGQENDSHITINIEDTGETMNNTPQIFNFDNNKQVRTIVINNEPHFVAKDIAEALEYSWKGIATIQHVPEQWRGVYSVQTPSGLQEMLCFTEQGLFFFASRSDKPKALPFQMWLSGEVLPSIRKHGFYGTYEWVEEQLSNPDTLITILQNYKTEKEAKIAAQQQVKQLNGKIEEDKPKVLFAESVVASETAILVGELAKLIKQNGYNIGQNRLFEWLRENGYMMRNSDGVNIPTQKSMNLGLFRMKEVSISTGEGKPPRICITTKVTGKGQLYFINKFLSKTPQQAA